MDSDKTAPSPPRLPAGTAPRGTLIAGRFAIKELAGRGGMGSVYRASDSVTGRLVALKLLYAATSDEATSRFHREAVLLSQLRHPGIVSYVAHGTLEDGQHYLAMEWLEGEDLARRLLREPLRLSRGGAGLRADPAGRPLVDGGDEDGHGGGHAGLHGAGAGLQ